jgi:hypothetical protein
MVVHLRVVMAGEVLLDAFGIFWHILGERIIGIDEMVFVAN